MISLAKLFPVERNPVASFSQSGSETTLQFREGGTYFLQGFGKHWRNYFRHQFPWEGIFLLSNALLAIYA